MIEVIGKKIILRDIVEKIKKIGFHSFSADEVTSGNGETLSLCFHYVDENMKIQEKFATFTYLERLTGEHIARKMLDFYEASEINSKQCRGQYYGGTQMCNQKRKGLPV